MENIFESIYEKVSEKIYELEIIKRQKYAVDKMLSDLVLTNNSNNFVRDLLNINEKINDIYELNDKNNNTHVNQNLLNIKKE